MLAAVSKPVPRGAKRALNRRARACNSERLNKLPHEEARIRLLLRFIATSASEFSCG